MDSNLATTDRADPNSIVISLRLDPAMAREFRMEAARRDMKLKKLFAEMWQAYQDKGTKGPRRAAG